MAKGRTKQTHASIVSHDEQSTANKRTKLSSSSSSSSSSSPGWYDDILDDGLRRKAHLLVHGCDWSWTKSCKDSMISPSSLIAYQLFILCKIGTGDVRASLEVNNNNNDNEEKRYQCKLSPSAEMDEVWHAHMLRPRYYIQMHKVLFEEELMGEDDNKDIEDYIIDHSTDSMYDSEEEKRMRRERMWGYMKDICPSYKEYISNENSTSMVPISYSQEVTNNSNVSESTSDTPMKLINNSVNSNSSSNNNGNIINNSTSNIGVEANKAHSTSNNDSTSVNNSFGSNDNIVSSYDANQGLRVVVREAGDVVVFKVKYTTPLRKIFEAYRNNRGIFHHKLRFVFDYCRVNGDDTPQSLGMKDNDHLYVYIDQDGC
jgi:hypothetical protein